eukprot:ANDGO_05471.mRNA.1 hypothetical protein
MSAPEILQPRSKSLSDFVAGVFKPGIQPEALAFFGLVAVSVLAICLFLVSSDPSNPHYYVLSFLALGLVLSLGWFLLQLFASPHPNTPKVAPAGPSLSRKGKPAGRKTY